MSGLSDFVKARIRSQKLSFIQFAWGVAAFILGMFMIYGSNTFFPGEASLEQEVATLIGLILAGAGFVTAMLAQCFLILHRLSQFPKFPDPDKPDEKHKD